MRRRVIVGAGLAGLQCTRLLAGHGLEVVLVDRKPSLDAVGAHHRHLRAALAGRLSHCRRRCLGPPIRHVTLYSPARRTLELESPHDEFRIGRMGPALHAAAQGLPGSRRRVARRHRVIFGCQPRRGRSLVRLDVAGAEQTLGCRFLIGADGADSRVARDLGLSVNRRWIVGLEDVFRRRRRLRASRDCTVFSIAGWRRATSPGSPRTADSVHVGVGGYRERFNPPRRWISFAPLGVGR